MALISRASSTGNINSDRRVIDMSEKMHYLEPDASPLVVLSRQLQKKVANNPKFEALEMPAQSRSTTAIAAATATATSVSTADYTIFAAGDVIKNTRTGEIITVTTSPTAAAVTVARGQGTTAGAAIVVGDELLIIGNANEENASMRDIRVQQTETFYNYTQKKMGAFVSDDKMKTLLYAGTSQYPEIPKGKNVQVEKIRREVIIDPSETTRRASLEKKMI